MREHSGEGSESGPEATRKLGRAAEPDQVAPASALKLAPHITAAEAVAVFRRKLPGAAAEATPVLHPFWWTALSARTRGIFARTRKGRRLGAPETDRSDLGQRMNVLVNAYSGKGYIADFEPQGAEVEVADWQAAFDASDQAGPTPSPFEVSRTARSLVRTKVLKNVKLGMGITLDETAPPRGILKPNWIVEGANEKFSATILVDGLDSSHYIIRVEKLS